MNPFQSYAYGYASPYNFPPEAPRTLEPMPVYSPRNAGYMGIYGTQPTREETPVSPGVSSVIRGMQDSSMGEGDKSDPMAAGSAAFDRGVSTQAPQSRAANAATMGSRIGAGLSLATGVPALGLIGAGIGTALDVRDINNAMALAREANPDYAERGAFENLSLSQALSGFANAVTGGFFGTPTEFSMVDNAIAGTAPSRGGATGPGTGDQEADVAAAGHGGTNPAGDLPGGQPGEGPGSGWARGGYVPGGSGGMDDDVPAIIDGKGPARLSSGEFVFDAATVAALGDGNNTAGAKKLDGLRKAIRKKAYGHEKQPPKNYSVGDLVRLYDKGR